MHLGPDHPVAYFCAEYGIHESLRIYSGGLGILAGDHLKSASDLGIPLVAIGLFYRGGFFIQTIDEEGGQQVVEVENDPAELPLERVVDREGRAVCVSMQLPEREIAITAWLVRVGGVRLYLLDTDCEPNDADDRAITRRLYPADTQLRILQEMVLGIGGELMLHALGIKPRVFHLNEGHAAFVVLARTARLRATGLDFVDAQDRVAATTVFTTHTPVPAGHDRFDLELFEEHFAHAPSWLGIEFEQLVSLGQAEGEELFNMTYLALRFSDFVNGVSRLHAVVSRELLLPAYAGREAHEVPIEGITNGVHLPSWTSPAVLELLGVAAHERIQGYHFAQRIDAVPSAALWRLRVEGRQRLVAALRAQGMPADEPAALWIGFARRFASYKRAGLLFHDLDRLARLVADPRRPLRIVFAGKAHPADKAGQKLIREVVEVCRDPRFLGRVLFVPNYEIDVARMLLEGVDVWLNNPQHGKEASGTSGMKAAANGAINLSIADGWWIEGANEHNGWTIGGAQAFDEQADQDAADALALYELLEREVLPAFFERDEAGIPNAWVDRMRASMRTIPVVFDSDRMVREYLTHAYEALASSG
ncbi:alpha-glucan family phosphorylase [Nannocystaceae bacterium ST9]